MQIELNADAKFILDTLHKAGFEAYIVGGSVRDAILKREADDIDITTNATPLEVKSLFKKTIDTGIQHGTVTVMRSQKGYEVTTYRIDGKYEDGRHPKEVIFVPSLTEDLKRRDFTINAMAYNAEEGLVDLFGGINDIEAKKIRCVGVPVDRFNEDALRILRALRFSAQLGYTIEEETLEAVKLLKENLKKISAERIQVEINKLLVSMNPDFIFNLYETGIMQVLFPKINKSIMENENQIENIKVSLKNTKANKVNRLIAFLYLADTLDAKDYFKCLKYDNDTKNQVIKVLEYRNAIDKEPGSDYEVRKLVSTIGRENFENLLELKKSRSKFEKNIDIISKWEKVYLEAKEKNYCLFIKELAITGNDCINLGIKKGPELGAKLEELLEEVLKDPTLNEKEKLSEICRR